VSVSRRQLLQGAGVAGLGLLAGCGRLPWQAQASPRVYRIGWLTPNDVGVDSAQASLQQAFLEQMRQLGYVEGQNLVIEYRLAGDAQRGGEMAAELVRLGVDLILVGGPAVYGAKAATSSIPIVFTGIGDPVGTGLVASLARPGGNLTGRACSPSG